MSNSLAIATVTEVLCQVVHTAAEHALSKTVVAHTGRPEEPGALADPSVYLYLYQVTVNGALRNSDLPTRSSDGRLQQKPQVALDLHYLIVFYGDDTELEAQRMLGAVMSSLHAQPVLGKVQIQNALDALTLLGKTYLDGSDLAEAVEQVKLTPVSLSLEENSKLWSVLLQTRHALSVAYQASVVLIESEDTPQQALPVSERGVTGIPFNQPLIEQIRVLNDEDEVLPIHQPIEAGATLLIKGKRLQGRITRVFIDDKEMTGASIADSEIRLKLPNANASSLRAGIKSLQVVHSIMLNEPPVEHDFSSSNVFPFALRPTIATVIMQGAAIQIQFITRVGKSQRVFLILNELNNPKPKSYRLNAPKDNGVTDPVTETDVIDFPAAGIVGSGTYLVRVQVDGAESMLQKAGDGKYDQPRVTVP